MTFNSIDQDVFRSLFAEYDILLIISIQIMIVMQ